MAINVKVDEIDHRTLKLVVGIIALSLAGLTDFFSNNTINSISASYYEGGWARDIFVGCLFAIGSFLLAYNGLSLAESMLSKVAAAAALGVALFPCACDNQQEILPYVHGGSAAIMFIVLAIFCVIFYYRAKSKQNKEAIWRSRIYAVCGLAMIMSVLLLAIDSFTSGAISSHITRLTFYGEHVALIAFGVSWLVASRALPVITAPAERHSLLK